MNRRLALVALTLAVSPNAFAEWRGPFLEHAGLGETMERQFGSQLLGLAPDAKLIPDTCRALSESTKATLGARDWVSGSSFSSAPELPFWDWYATCTQKYVGRATNAVANMDLTKFLGSKASTWLKNNGKTLMNAKWKELPGEVKSEVILQILDTSIGLGVLQEFGHSQETLTETFIPARIETLTKTDPFLKDVIDAVFVVTMSMDENFLE